MTHIIRFAMMPFIFLVFVFRSGISLAQAELCYIQDLPFVIQHEVYDYALFLSHISYTSLASFTMSLVDLGHLSEILNWRKATMPFILKPIIRLVRMSKFQN